MSTKAGVFGDNRFGVVMSVQSAVGEARRTYRRHMRRRLQTKKQTKTKARRKSHKAGTRQVSDEEAEAEAEAGVEDSRVTVDFRLPYNLSGEAFGMGMYCKTGRRRQGPVTFSTLRIGVSML